MENQTYEILSKIQNPADVRALPKDQMEPLCAELRRFLIEKVTKNGGHLASNLGVVELSVAIHRVFNLPHDRVIFDVGHQCYVHKILSGRREAFDTLRKPGGLSGFEKMSESEYDAFGTGHASTSVSAALGYAKADKILGRDNYTLVVLGDGAFTGGLVHEALNNCDPDLRLIIVLNENEMSISKNIGTFAHHIAHIRSSKRYINLKKRTTRFIRAIPLVGNTMFSALRDTKKMFKNSLFGSSYFEELGLFYLGPADGNDFDTVEYLLNEAKNKGESVILHLKTKKGMGYPPAEENPSRYHLVGGNYQDNFSQHFGRTLVRMAQGDDRICAVTAAMESGVGLSDFAKAFPDRFFDVGIAEAHAVTFAAGLAAAQMKPYVAIYSSFLQRSYDNILHDVALQNLPVRFLVDRASLAGGDGPTHHGIFDVSFLSSIPNLHIFAPATFASLDRFLAASADASVPLAIRYPNAGENPRVLERFFEKDGTQTVAHADFFDPEDNAAVIITYGEIVTEAMTAADKLQARGISCGVILLETLKPYAAPADRIAALLPSHGAAVVFLEEGIKNGGAGMLTFEALRLRHPDRMQNKLTAIQAVDDHFAVQTRNEPIRKTAKISADDVLRTLVHLIPRVNREFVQPVASKPGADREALP